MKTKLPQTPEIKKLQRELAKRQAIEESQKEMAEIGRNKQEELLNSFYN